MQTNQRVRSARLAALILGLFTNQLTSGNMREAVGSPEATAGKDRDSATDSQTRDILPLTTSLYAVSIPWKNLSACRGPGYV